MIGESWRGSSRARGRDMPPFVVIHCGGRSDRGVRIPDAESDVAAHQATDACGTPKRAIHPSFARPPLTLAIYFELLR